MSGYTSYECTCGGTIVESWDREKNLANCDKCSDPAPRDLKNEEQE